MTDNPFKPPESDLRPTFKTPVDGSRFLNVRCPVCDVLAVNRLRAVFSPRCGYCGCRLKRYPGLPVASHVLGMVVLYLSIAVGIWMFSVLPLLLGFAFSLLMGSAGRLVPNQKDPETRIRMRMQKLRTDASARQ